MDIVEKYRQTRDQLLQDRGMKAQSQFIATRGPVKNVHYLELGSGKPLIMIHGGGSHSSAWIPILKPLSEHFHLYVVDRPGCGLTDAFDYRGVAFRESASDFVESFMDALRLEKALLMGQSMGGYFSIVFALKHPERVEKLLLIGAPAGMNRWIPPLLRMLGTKGLNRLLVKTVARPSVSNLKMVHQRMLMADADRLSYDYLEHSYYGQLLPGSEQGFLSLLERVLTPWGWRKKLYIGDQLHGLTMPVRFIWGDRDAFEKPESGKPKAAAIPDMKFEVVEDAGHCPWLDQPETCARLTLALLEDAQSAPASM